MKLRWLLMGAVLFFGSISASQANYIIVRVILNLDGNGTTPNGTGIQGGGMIGNIGIPPNGMIGAPPMGMIGMGGGMRGIGGGPPPMPMGGGMRGIGSGPPACFAIWFHGSTPSALSI